MPGNIRKDKTEGKLHVSVLRYPRYLFNEKVNVCFRVLFHKNRLTSFSLCDTKRHADTPNSCGSICRLQSSKKRRLGECGGRVEATLVLSWPLNVFLPRKTTSGNFLLEFMSRSKAHGSFENHIC